MTQRPLLLLPLRGLGRGPLLGVLFVVGGALVACGSSSEQTGTGDAKLPAGVRSENVEHEACDESGNKVDNLDANGDGKPDVRRVYDKGTGKEVCRITDLNHDGKPDMFEYYDAAGNLRRREADYDDSGVVDAIEFYQGGKLVQRDLDTDGQNRIDTWDYFDPASGKRLRRERDASGNGRVDQWWTFDGERVTIAFDKNNDGKPDPNDVVTMGGPPAAPAQPAPAAPADAGAAPAPASTASPDSATDGGTKK